MTANRWPHLIALIGLLFLGLTGWALLSALTGASPVSDPRYYDHGLRYNHTQLEHQTAQGLGWRVAVVIGEHRLEAHLADGSDRPITGATGELKLAGVDLPLAETDAGRYCADLPPHLRGGAVSALIVLQRGGAAIRRTLLLSL